MKDHTGWQKLIRAVPEKYNLNKSVIDLEQVVGQPFGTIFEVQDRHTGELAVVTDPREYLTKAFLEEVAFGDDDGVDGKDNRDIVVNEHLA
jgi:tRNA (adenine58-N1)-methyltransferase non-catalytic subunit